MGIFDKVMFWKKDNDFDFDKLTDTNFNDSKPLQDNTSLDQNSSDPFGDQNNPVTPTNQPQPPAMNTPSPFQQNTPQDQKLDKQEPNFNYQLPNRDLELISSKLDTIKAILMSLDQRTSNLEKIAGVGKRKDEHNLW
mgnify:CR=1 FL=1